MIIYIILIIYIYIKKLYFKIGHLVSILEIKMKLEPCYHPQMKFAKVMFLQVSVILSMGGHAWLLGGVCMVALGVCGCSQGGGHAWLLLGGMHGCSRGHAWLLPGGIRGCSGGHAWLLPRGCAWLLWGGVHGCSGGHAWFSGGHAWFFRGACMVFSMRYGQ